MKFEAALSDVIGEACRIEGLKGASAERIISEMLECLVAGGELSSEQVVPAQRAILARELEATTGIGNGIAIPHMKNCPYVSRICGVFGRSRTGIEFSSTDAEEVRLFFLILTPDSAASAHVQIMKKIVRMSRDRKTLQYLISTDNFDNLQGIFEELDDQSE